MIELDEMDDANEGRTDYRRANGAPLVSDPNNPDKTLRYRRPSGYNELDDENALVEWRIWKAMTGVASSKALAAEVAVTKDEDKAAKKLLKDKAMDRGKANEAADMGTALHAMTARIEDSEDLGWVAPEQFEGDLRSYVEMLEEYGLVSEMVEVHMVNDEYRAAGTADRIYRLTKPLVTPNGDILDIGTLVIADLKTGQKLDFSMPGYSIQMALYASGKLYDIHLERRLPTPDINQDWGILVHMPVGKAKAEALWCPLEKGNYGAWLSNEVKLWQKQWKKGDYGYDMPAVELLPELPATPSQLLEEGGIGVVEVAEATIEEMVDYCGKRIRTIGEHPKAKETLILWWPADCPTPKSGKLTSPDDIVRLLNLLDKVEANYSIPFTHPDPRKTTGHKSKIDRSNEFLLVN